MNRVDNINRMPILQNQNAVYSQFCFSNPVHLLKSLVELQIDRIDFAISGERKMRKLTHGTRDEVLFLYRLVKKYSRWSAKFRGILDGVIDNSELNQAIETSDQLERLWGELNAQRCRVMAETRSEIDTGTLFRSTRGEILALANLIEKILRIQITSTVVDEMNYERDGRPLAKTG